MFDTSTTTALRSRASAVSHSCLVAALLSFSCCAGEQHQPADGVDVTLTDVAPDASEMSARQSHAKGLRQAPSARAALQGGVRQQREQPQAVPSRQPATGNAPAPLRPHDDHGLIAGANTAQPSPGDPDAAKRQFFLAWVRVSMPTAGPGTAGTLSAVFTPRPHSEEDYWRVSDSEVLCVTGKASIRGTNLTDIDCGAPQPPAITPEPNG